MKFTSILKFFRLYKEPSQETLHTNHVNELIEKNKFTEAYALVDNGYVMTNKQANTCASYLADVLTDTKTIKLSSIPEKENFSALVSIVDKSKKHELFFAEILPPVDDHMEMLFYTMHFGSKFFFKQSFRALITNPNYHPEHNPAPLILNPEDNLMNQVVDFYIASLQKILENPSKKNSNRIEKFFKTIPIELHPHFIEKEIRLKDHVKTKYYFSIASTYEEQLTEGVNNNQPILENEKTTLRALKAQKEFAIKFEDNISTFVQKKVSEHEQILAQVKSKNREQIIKQDFATCNLEKIYKVPEEYLGKLKLIQALYAKLVLDNDISVEHKHYIQGIPENTFKALDTYSETRELIKEKSDANFLLESIDIIAENLSRLNLDIETNKVNNLSSGNTLVRKMGH